VWSEQRSTLAAAAGSGDSDRSSTQAQALLNRGIEAITERQNESLARRRRAEDFRNVARDATAQHPVYLRHAGGKQFWGLFDLQRARRERGSPTWHST
jgi:hypothetical protein